MILAGILFHQWADFSWAVIFFGLLQRWTAQLRPRTLALIAVPWALFTSGTEWLLLVPVLPFAQPIFTLSQPYWIGALVHVSAAALYPLFPYLRDWMANRRPSPHRRVAAGWAGGAMVVAAGLGLLAFLGTQDREWPPHPGRNVEFDQAYMRRMAAHHAQGIELGLIAVERAEDPHLRALARLIVANQKGETEIFANWWRSWFEGALPQATPEDHATMPGMLRPEDLAELAQLPAGSFDARFIALMTFHHQGAIAMADQAIREAGTIRLRLMSHAIRHAQRGEIELMQGREGFGATRAAIANMLRPAGEVLADGALGAERPPRALSGLREAPAAGHLH
ncbi:DUF305 domain-containing protein [Roseicella aerolata]|uniref:DUF305 domain-containing protein n=1 Tax=Roseicella aerolata TaxID=2883479 RepID=A0A9X1IBX5_9PROT|nr:DUF305 domain-containing protein [Roseicella aerolata]